jgi:adenine-specific DNA methylase
MLNNGLGEAIAAATPTAKRFVDMFTGSASVAWHVAERFDMPVLALDLQSYAVVLAKSVVSRVRPVEHSVLEMWLERADNLVRAQESFCSAAKIQSLIRDGDIMAAATSSRNLCDGNQGAVTRAYGGYYYSPQQALWLDALRSTLTEDVTDRNVCLAALIWAASRTAASPGHTAQPFKPNLTAGRFLREAWLKDVKSALEASFCKISSLHAKQAGEAVVGDANNAAASLRDDDLVFIDPPYSSVHYSRFYHVLETLTVYKSFDALGEGRYPPSETRALSLYSQQRNALTALRSLFAQISSRGASAIVTFPAGSASNGISGDDVVSSAAEYFNIRSVNVSGRFSTLGGNKKHRQARVNSEELILTLSSKGAGNGRSVKMSRPDSCKALVASLS